MKSLRITGERLSTRGENIATRANTRQAAEEIRLRLMLLTPHQATTRCDSSPPSLKRNRIPLGI
jgi:hypothetical protein